MFFALTGSSTMALLMPFAFGMSVQLAEMELEDMHYYGRKDAQDCVR